MSFTKDFSAYENCVPPGVRLPKIEIEARHYDRLELDHKTSNYDFLRALCLDGVKEKKIDKYLINKIFKIQKLAKEILN